MSNTRWSFIGIGYRLLVLALILISSGCGKSQNQSGTAPAATQPASQPSPAASGAAQTTAVTQSVASQQPGALIIRKAVYGDLTDGGPTIDVTDKVRGWVKDGTLYVDATPQYFPDSPAQGRQTLVRVTQKTPGLYISGPGYADITDQCKDMASIQITGEGFTVYYKYGDGPTLHRDYAGGATADLPPLIPFQLRVDYTVNGVDMSKTSEPYKPLIIKGGGISGAGQSSSALTNERLHLIIKHMLEMEARLQEKISGDTPQAQLLSMVTNLGPAAGLDADTVNNNESEISALLDCHEFSVECKREGWADASNEDLDPAQLQNAIDAFKARFSEKEILVIECEVDPVKDSALRAARWKDVGPDAFKKK
jgi:hypothetical protein